MTLRVGLIGLGEVAQLMHLPLLADDRRYEIAGVSDISAELTQTLGQRYGARLRVTDADLLIDDAGIDAVFILTPDQLHAPQLARAIGAGKHVFVEKPACLTAGELEAILAMSARGIVFVGYMRRYARSFLALKSRMPALSEIRHVRIRDLICEAPFFTAQSRPVLRPMDLPDGFAAQGRSQADDLVRKVLGHEASADEMRAYRVLTGLASHSLSSMRDLLGVPKGVICAAQKGGESVTAIYDYGNFTCVYEAVITDIPIFDAGVEILTADARYSLTTDTPYIRNLPTTLSILGLGPEGAQTQRFGPYHEDPFRAELDAFHSAITQEAPVRTTLEDSLADLVLIGQTAKAFCKG